MRWKRHSLFLLPAACMLVAGVWAQVRETGQKVENQIRQAAFGFFVGSAFGDADPYFKAARMPLLVVRDGVGTPRDEKAARTLLTANAARMKAANYNEEDRKRIIGNMIGLIDDSSVQFIGANTATLAFPLRPATKPDEPESMIELVLHRKDGRWQVIAEITDSAPIPPEYLK